MSTNNECDLSSSSTYILIIFPDISLSSIQDQYKYYLTLLFDVIKNFCVLFNSINMSIGSTGMYRIYLKVCANTSIGSVFLTLTSTTGATVLNNQYAGPGLNTVS